MSVFEAVKSRVTTRQAAVLYGINVKPNGMAVCPFHNDRNPSMKVDKRFHCFGCQADGDVIDFTARLYGISAKTAADKLASDFGISYNSSRLTMTKPSITKQLEATRINQAEQRCFHALSTYRHLLMKWRTEYAPQPTDVEWHPLFVESLQRLCEVENLLDTLLSSSAQDKATIMIEHGKEIPVLERRLSELAAGNETSVSKRSRSLDIEHER